MWEWKEAAGHFDRSSGSLADSSEASEQNYAKKIRETHKVDGVGYWVRSSEDMFEIDRIFRSGAGNMRRP